MNRNLLRRIIGSLGFNVTYPGGMDVPAARLSLYASSPARIFKR